MTLSSCAYTCLKYWTMNFWLRNSLATTVSISRNWTRQFANDRQVRIMRASCKDQMLSVIFSYKLPTTTRAGQTQKSFFAFVARGVSISLYTAGQFLYGLVFGCWVTFQFVGEQLWGQLQGDLKVRMGAKDEVGTFKWLLFLPVESGTFCRVITTSAYLMEWEIFVAKVHLALQANFDLLKAIPHIKTTHHQHYK